MLMTARFIVEAEESARSWGCLTAQRSSAAGECAVISIATRCVALTAPTGSCPIRLRLHRHGENAPGARQSETIFRAGRVQFEISDFGSEMGFCPISRFPRAV